MKACLPVLPVPALALSFSLMACSSSPKILARNEINDPIFHQTHYADIGVSGGPTWTRHDGVFRFTTGPGFTDTVAEAGFFQDYYFVPRFAYTRMAGKSASFAWIPVYWNFLLTGDQYADSVNLAAKRVHLSVHCGINGFAYSQRSGWVFPAEFALAGKYLLGPRGFLVGHLAMNWVDVMDSAMRYGASLAAGRQLTARGSLLAEYRFTYHDFPARTWADLRGIGFRDGDVQSDMNIRYTFYATPKHVFGSEAGAVFRGRGMEDNFSLSAGAHYRFVFE